MKLINFDDVANKLNLNPEERETDELCFNAAYSYFEKTIGFNMEEKNYNEYQIVIDSKVYVNEINISELINIIDVNTNELVTDCTIDAVNKAIFFVPAKHENHTIFINYNAGYTQDNLPEELKEAVIKLFLIKKNDFYNKLNNAETDKVFSLPDDIKNVFDSYKRKSL